MSATQTKLKKHNRAFLFDNGEQVTLVGIIGVIHSEEEPSVLRFELESGDDYLIYRDKVTLARIFGHEPEKAESEVFE